MQDSSFPPFLFNPSYTASSFPSPWHPWLLYSLPIQLEKNIKVKALVTLCVYCTSPWRPTFWNLWSFTSSILCAFNFLVRQSYELASTCEAYIILFRTCKVCTSYYKQVYSLYSLQLHSLILSPCRRLHLVWE